MSEDRDLAGPEAFAQDVDQLVEVGDELPDGHRGSGDFAVERFAGPALIPVDNGEALFERRVEVTKRTVSLSPGPPCSRINGGLATLSPRIMIHCSFPPSRR